MGNRVQGAALQAFHVSPFKERVYPRPTKKKKILSAHSHPRVVQNRCDFSFSVEHKIFFFSFFRTIKSVILKFKGLRITDFHQ